MIRIGHIIEGQHIDTLASGICKIIKTANECNSSDEVIITALTVLSEYMKIKELNIENCVFNHKGENNSRFSIEGDTRGLSFADPEPKVFG